MVSLRTRLAIGLALGLCLFVVCEAPQTEAQAHATAPNFATLSAKAQAARDADRLDEAVTLYRKALALKPSWAEGWIR